MQYIRLRKNPERAIMVKDERGIMEVYLSSHNIYVYTCVKFPNKHKFYTNCKDYGKIPYTIVCEECLNKDILHPMTFRQALKSSNDRVRCCRMDGYWYRPGLWYFLTHRYEREHLLGGGLILKRLEK